MKKILLRLLLVVSMSSTCGLCGYVIKPKKDVEVVLKK